MRKDFRISSLFHYQIAPGISTSEFFAPPPPVLPESDALHEIERRLLTRIYRDRIEMVAIARELDIIVPHLLGVKSKALLRMAREGIDIRSPEDILEFVDDPEARFRYVEQIPSTTLQIAETSVEPVSDAPPAFFAEPVIAPPPVAEPVVDLAPPPLEAVTLPVTEVEAESGAVSKLTRRQWQVLYLLSVENLSPVQARAVLEISKKKFDSALALATKKLEDLDIDPSKKSQVRAFLDNPEKRYAAAASPAPGM